MSVDELAVDRLIQLAEERSGAGRSLAVIPGEGEGRRSSQAPRLGRGSSIVSWEHPSEDPGLDGQDDVSCPDDQSDEEEAEGGSDDSSDDDQSQGEGGDCDPELEDPTFVRPRRPLKR